MNHPEQSADQIRADIERTRERLGGTVEAATALPLVPGQSYALQVTALGELVTAAADQYSLGTMAYYLLTGAHPYLGRTQRELFCVERFCSLQL